MLIIHLMKYIMYKVLSSAKFPLFFLTRQALRSSPGVKGWISTRLWLHLRVLLRLPWVNSLMHADLAPSPFVLISALPHHKLERAQSCITGWAKPPAYAFVPHCKICTSSWSRPFFVRSLDNSIFRLFFVSTASSTCSSSSMKGISD